MDYEFELGTCSRPLTTRDRKARFRFDRGRRPLPEAGSAVLRRDRPEAGCDAIGRWR